MSPMRSELQVQAFRRNSALSRSPVTPAGQQNPSQNAIRYGLSARTVVCSVSYTLSEQPVQDYIQRIASVSTRSALKRISPPSNALKPASNEPRPGPSLSCTASANSARPTPNPSRSRVQTTLPLAATPANTSQNPNQRSTKTNPSPKLLPEKNPATPFRPPGRSPRRPLRIRTSAPRKPTQANSSQRSTLNQPSTHRPRPRRRLPGIQTNAPRKRTRASFLHPYAPDSAKTSPNPKPRPGENEPNATPQNLPQKRTLHHPSPNNRPAKTNPKPEIPTKENQHQPGASRASNEPKDYRFPRGLQEEHTNQPNEPESDCSCSNYKTEPERNIPGPTRLSQIRPSLCSTIKVGTFRPPGANAGFERE